MMNIHVSTGNVGQYGASGLDIVGSPGQKGDPGPMGFEGRPGIPGKAGAPGRAGLNVHENAMRFLSGVYSVRFVSHFCSFRCLSDLYALRFLSDFYLGRLTRAKMKQDAETLE